MILVYDQCDVSSFKDLKGWMAKILDTDDTKDLPRLIIGNKEDLLLMVRVSLSHFLFFSLISFVRSGICNEELNERGKKLSLSLLVG